jgi:EAL domain-containing protein (putative c-di-GMP-specific phosphodiesterase class I)
MRALKALGVSLALDDFGTGVCSLATLATLPLDQLKIDWSLTSRLDAQNEPANVLVAQSIIALGHTLGMDILAEGVETEMQRAFLQRHGCLAYQGYLMSRPMTLEAFESAYLH